MADHDHTYKLLFSHPQMVRDLLEGFVGGEWLAQVDFNTLERVSGTYVSDNLRARADDIVWRVRCQDHHVYLLIEFQSSTDTFMAVRVLTYVSLLYQDLIRTNEISNEGLLPAIVPIVLHNGSTRWRVAENVRSLLREPPAGLEKYRAELCYLLIDEGRYTDTELARQHNLVALLFRLENCRQRDHVEHLVSMLVDCLTNSDQESLRRAFAVWLDRVILARLSGGVRVRTTNELWEARSMLSDWFDQREAQLRQEGRQQGEAALLSRQLQKRFGDLPDSVLTRLRDAPQDQLEHWGERVLEVASLQELFTDEAAPES